MIKVMLCVYVCVVRAKLLQSCLTLCHPMDCSHGIYVYNYMKKQVKCKSMANSCQCMTKTTTVL